MPNPMTVTDTRSAVAYIKARVSEHLTSAMGYTERAELFNRLGNDVARDAAMDAARTELRMANELSERLEACRV